MAGMVLPEITKGRGEGFCDILLAIRAVTFTAEGACTLAAVGRFEKTEVGIAVRIQPGMRPGFLDSRLDRTAFFRDSIRIRSIGAASDRFLAALAKLYEVPLVNPVMRREVVFTSFSLAGDPRKLREQYVQMKLFHDDAATFDEYCQLYFNVNLPRREVELREKDSDYRSSVIKALQRSG